MKRLLMVFMLICCLFSVIAQENINSNNNKMDSQKLYITINGKKVSATLVNNSSTKALTEKLAAGPITYEAHDYGDFEKVGNLPWVLPRNDEDITTVPGDLILYLGSRFVIYYDQNHWDFTKLGKLDQLTQQEIKDLVRAGNGNVQVTLSLD